MLWIRKHVYEKELTKETFSSCHTKHSRHQKKCDIKDDESVEYEPSIFHDKDCMCVGNLLQRKPDAKCIDNACLVCYMSRQPESMLLCLHASICASVLMREKRRREKTTVQMRGKDSDDGKLAFNWLISIDRLGFWERKNKEHKEEKSERANDDIKEFLKLF